MKEKPTIISLWREWLVPDNAYRRFKGLRGIYWYWLSRDVRETEWKQYGVCITCLEPLESWQDGDCGHMVPSAKCGEFLRFYRPNLALQHKKCNNPKFTPNAGIKNTINYDKRYGAGAMEALLALTKKICKEPTQEQYRELINSLPSYQLAKKLHDSSVEPTNK